MFPFVSTDRRADLLVSSQQREPTRFQIPVKTTGATSKVNNGSEYNMFAPCCISGTQREKDQTPKPIKT